ncbi:MAG TPA: hypothetical protein VGC14_22585 [Rhizobium sp.]
MDPTLLEAFERLIAVARQDTGQGKRVAAFILAWWNAGANGGFDLSDLFALDASTCEDLITVFSVLARSPRAIYPDDYEQEIHALAARWRPRTGRGRRRQDASLRN